MKDETITVTISWETGPGPTGPQEIQKLLESHYNNHFKVHRVNLDTNKMPEKLTYSVSEAAAILGISKAKLYSLLYQKQIPSIQYGKRWIIPKVGLEKQLGGSIEQKEQQILNEIERANLVATAEEAIKLYELLHGKLQLLVKHLSKNESNLR
jgi:excisionase family DNA binding protein